MSDWAPTDANDKYGLFAVSNVDGKTLVRLEADPITGALIVTSLGGGTQVLNEIVAGSGTSWTLANTPNSAGVALYANGQRLTPGGVDYTLSGSAITTVLSWTSGTVLADYTH